MEGEPDDSGGAEPLPDAPLKAILEALLFASQEPIDVAGVAEILGADRAAEIERALESLVQEYEARGGGLRVRPIAGGFRITTEPSLGPFVREMVRSRNRQRLSRAALETLAVVAYKQPITAPEIQEIRGVNPSSILGSLLDRRLVRILGRKKVVGKPFVYGTTREFLVRFGLNTLADLPSMDEFEQLLQAEAGDREGEDAPAPVEVAAGEEAAGLDEDPDIGRESPAGRDGETFPP